MRPGWSSQLPPNKLVECALQAVHEDHSDPHIATLGETRPVEQAGFRKGFSCLEHIQAVAVAIEVCREFRMPLVLFFVDYGKASDSVKTNVALSGLVDQRVEPPYIRTRAAARRSSCSNDLSPFP
ncbi:unnamed protein product [Haemonchus placei]|uniref:Piwi domain-containing protein n=1 Tax=Haemonchus placei TaxID=6290 RepID=A0A0N4WZ21_HAEPC|nr:unnamed protein product [Haemonchus placei]